MACLPERAGEGLDWGSLDGGASADQGAPDDAERLAAVEVAAWRAAYRGLMPEAYPEGLSEAAKTEEWRRSLAKHGHAGRKRVLVAEAGAR